MASQSQHLSWDFFKENHIKALYQKYGAELNTDRMRALKKDSRGNPDGGICHVDGELVYMIVRELGVQHAIEFSPNEGYSTAFIHEALQKNHKTFSFASFDLNLLPAFERRMQDFDIGVLFYQGDALENIPKYLDTHGLSEKIEFCFVDSDHSYDFARRYCAEIFPLMSENCVYFVHDMCYRPLDFQKFSHYGEILPIEIGGTVSALGEAGYLCEHFVLNPHHVIFSTHKLFGDQHEYSSILPRNLDLIEDLSDMVDGFHLPPSAGQKGGMPRPPMGLFVVPRVLFGLDR